MVGMIYNAESKETSLLVVCDTVVSESCDLLLVKLGKYATVCFRLLTRVYGHACFRMFARGR